jgi:hypothetical protein
MGLRFSRVELSGRNGLPGEKGSGNCDQLIRGKPRYLRCVNIFFYLYRKSLLCYKRLHTLGINNSLNVLCSKTSTPQLILTEKYDRFLHTELRVSISVDQHKQDGMVSLPSTGFLLGLLFYPEDGGGMFLWNVLLSPNYKALQHRRLFSLQ